ncbi:GerAB/ArcD/ProY family transporter [Sporosarcina pasteurii]|uniref:Spore germination protein (Amino acid permease) n=1 Tax=Sporosarcina pasteurii TaxID=1474 RepID=A0A380C5A2_SPOPA|nr:GerAB/ArcD/ProY family transporter [Sporosarcina pasteurii]MDS9471683.1 GerAB/ArcD/ProY family transporter [Sporosarcina pasteurii]SUJ12001.1 spore germination protein (amino acid permease) [Sporosarcina pasteurii]
MNKNEDGKIGTREFFSIVLLIIGVKVTDETPGYLFQLGGNATWLIPFFQLVIISIPFMLLLALIKKYEKGLIELIFHLSGKFLGSVICFTLFFIMFFSITNRSKSSASIISTLFYQKTSVSLLTLALLLTSFFIAKRGLKAISSGTWLLIPVLEITLILLLFIVWKEVSWLRLFPLAGPGLGTLLTQSFNHSFILGEVILLAAFFPYTRTFKNYQLASLLGLGVAAFKLMLFLAIYVAVFDYPSTKRMAYPHQELTRIAEFGTSISHVEGFFLYFWLFAILFRFAICLYLLAFFLGSALRLKNFEKLLVPLAGLIALSSLLPANTYILIPYREVMFKIGSWLLITLPFFLWALSKLRGGRQDNETNNSAA